MASPRHGDHLKKGVFAKKCTIQRLRHHLHTATTSTALLCIYVDGRFFICCDIFTKAISKLSSTRNMSQCKGQQATFSFKSVHLHLYSCSLRVG